MFEDLKIIDKCKVKTLNHPLRILKI